jgi:type IV fimbrial biogenesis protein FimT
LVILAILMSVGTPSFMAWIQNTQLRTAAETLTSGLQMARTEAVRRNTSVQFTLNGTVNTDSGWTVGCVNPVADLNADGVLDCPAVIQSRTGSEGTSNAVVNADVANVTFAGLGRATNAMTIDITNPKGGTCMGAGGQMRCLRILVTTGGSVRMCNPALPSSNPQGC